MIGMLSGATVRDQDGTKGRITHWHLPEVKIGWEDDGKLLPREEELEQGNPRLENQIEVLTLDAGWVPLGGFMSECGVPTPGHSTITQMRRLLDQTEMFDVHEVLDRAEQMMRAGSLEEAEKLIEEAQRLFEVGKEHWPYKNKSTLGPGPLKGTNKQSDFWDCNCSNYRCTCKGPEGQRKIVKIKKAYKKWYNKLYKAWLKKKK
jgi:hypothetical protein